MAITTKPHIIQHVSYVIGRDPRSGFLVHKGARQTVYVEGLDAGPGIKAVEQAKNAALNAFTNAQLDNPSLPGLIVLESEARLLSGGTNAMVFVEWGLPEFYSSLPVPPRTAWSNDYTLMVDRFLDKASNLTGENGDTAMRDTAGRLVEVKVPIPASIIHRLIYADVLPSDVMAGVGTFTTIGGVADTVRILPPHVVEYGSPGHFTYRVELAYEWRKPCVTMSDGVGVNGWGEQYLDGSDVIHEIGPTGAPSC